MLHCAPSQCSISVLERVSEQPSLQVSTVVHDEPPAQTSLEADAATPASELFTTERPGLDTMLHCVPFQCSARDWLPPAPTAQTSLAAMTLTPFSWFRAGWVGPGSRLGLLTW